MAYADTAPQLGHYSGTTHLYQGRTYSDAQWQQMMRQGAAGGGTNSLASVEGLFDPQTGLPTRLPNSPQEAMLFQLQATRMARQMQQRQLGAALSSLRYGLGWTQRQSPYGLGYLMSPLLSQMSQTQANVQYAPSDFSYFVRGRGGGLGGRVVGGTGFGMNFGGGQGGGLFPTGQVGAPAPQLGWQAGAIPGGAAPVQATPTQPYPIPEMFPQEQPQDMGQMTTAYDPEGQQYSPYQGG